MDIYITRCAWLFKNIDLGEGRLSVHAHTLREHKVLLIQLPYLALEQGVFFDRKPSSVKVSDERSTLCLFSAKKFCPKNIYSVTP